MKTNNEYQTSEEIIKRICECGWSAYLCGGAIRDEFLEKDPNDYDIVTDALPEDLEKIFSDKKIKTFGVSFLVTSIDGIDVATYRSEKNSGPGRFNCITKACETLEEDLARRDFTFNALAACPYTGEVIDPFNGRKDLENRIVKFVGDPDQRIYEDPLRMIRAARFASLIEGYIDPDAFYAIKRNRSKVKDIFPERIRIELLKVMTYKKPSIFFDVLYDTSILDILLPELSLMYNHTGGKYHSESLDIHFKITGDSLSNNDPILRLVGYLHDIGKPVVYDGVNFIDHEKIGEEITRRIFRRYRFTNKETSRAKKLVRYHMRSINSLQTEKSIRRLLRIFSENNVSFKDWLKLKIADKKGNLSCDDYTKDEIKEFSLRVYKATKLTKKKQGMSIADLKINGHDIMNTLKIDSGVKVGLILNTILKMVIDDPELNERDKLISYINNNF